MHSIRTPFYRYDEFVDESSDNSKIHHEAYDITGMRFSIDYSPYFKMTQEAFELWVVCGMPDRRTFKSNGPMTVEQLRKFKKNKVA